MTTPRTAPSIRAHLLAIVLLGAIVPLTLIGFFITRSGVRSGERLLDRQLTSSLATIERSIAARWEYRRGELLLLAENENARAALASGVVSRPDSVYFTALAAALEREISVFTYRDATGRGVYSSAPVDESGLAAGPDPRQISVRYPVRGADGVELGSVDALVYLEGLIPSDSARLLLPGSALAVRDRARDAVLLPLNPAVRFPDSTTVSVGGEPWMVRSLRIEDPPFDLAVAAPITPYVEPFERAARMGLMAVGAVALLALLLSGFLTARLAGSVDELVDAAGAVAGGDLTRRAKPGGPAELHRLAASFNTMTESLRTLVSELSERRALAAVGEFAASLAHEVRNALTSVQIDLERVEERTEDRKNRVMLGRSLSHVRRLDAAVTGALRVARSGTIEPEDVAVGEVVWAAAQLAQPSYEAAGARIEVSPATERVVVRGDADALRQMFLNLLLNAEAWLPPAGTTNVSVASDGGRVIVSIADTGAGMSGEQVSHAFDPYYTTRPGGTGLGLPIARQIALAHAGDVSIRSTVGAGTTVEVSLPIRPAARPA